MPIPLARARFGMRLDQNARAGMFCLRVVKHLGKPRMRHIRVGQGGSHGRITDRLIDYQNIARFWQGQVRVVSAVLGKLQCLDPCDVIPCAFQQGGIVQRVFYQERFQIGWRRCIEMQTRLVQRQAKRWFISNPTRMQRPQKRVLDTQNIGGLAFRYLLPARGTGCRPPNANPVFLRWPPKTDLPSGQFKDALDPGLRQKTAVVDTKTPGFSRPGV